MDFKPDSLEMTTVAPNEAILTRIDELLAQNRLVLEINGRLIQSLSTPIIFCQPKEASHDDTKC